MEVAGDANGQPSDDNLTYPYGWHGLADTVWTSHPEYKPIGLYNEKENTSILRKASANPKYFIKFETFEASFMSICEFLKNHNNNAGRWFSLDTSEQKKYNELISQIKPAFTNEISN
jgi:hypothetical protein